MKLLRTVLAGILCLTLATASLSQDITVSSSRDKQKFTYRNGSPLQSFEVESRGIITLTDDDKDVKRISADGYLEIEKTVFGSTRKIVITPEGDGPKRQYYEGRSFA